MENDRFYIKTEFKPRSMTKQGLLGYIMSPYNPMGLATPAMLKCKLLQREIIPQITNDPHKLHALDETTQNPGNTKDSGKI